MTTIFNSTAAGPLEPEDGATGQFTTDADVAVLVALSVFLGIVQFVGILKFQANKHLPIVKRRYPNLVLIESVVVMIVLMIIVPLTLINNQWIANQSQYDTDSGYMETAVWLRTCLWSTVIPAASYFLSMIEALRLWMLFYELCLLESMQDDRWETKMTSNLWRTDFYLKSRDKLGNISWLQKRVLFLWFFMTVVTAAALFNVHNDAVYTARDETISHWMTALIQRLPLSIVAYIYVKAPKQQHDYLMINYEFRGTCYLLVISLIGYIDAVIFRAYGNEGAAFVAATLSWLFTVSVPSLMATLWIPMKIKAEQRMAVGMFAESLALESGLFGDRRLNADGTRTGTVRGEMAILWADEHKTKALFKAMTQDFELQTILCFIELVQFKENVITLISRRNPLFIADNVVEQRYKLYNNCMQSAIVFGGNIEALQFPTIDSEHVVEMAAFDEPEHKEPSNETTVKQTARNLLESALNEVDQDFEIVLDAADLCRFQLSAMLIFDKFMKTGAAFEVDMRRGLKMQMNAVENTGYASLRPMEWVSLYDNVLRELELPIEAAYARMIRRLYKDQQETNSPIPDQEQFDDVVIVVANRESGSL